MYKKIIGIFSKDMAIDLGTANTLVSIRSKGIIINEPSVVARYRLDGEYKYIIGREAKNMIGKTPRNIETIRPMRDGVISDFDMTKKMIRYFMQKSHKRSSFISPRVIVCVPFGLTEVEKSAIIEATKEAGAREVYLIEEPIAAALGADIAIGESKGNLIVDIGGGTSEIGVISLGGLVVCKSLRVAGDKIDYAIIEYIKKNHSIVIGELMAEEIKIGLGSAIELKQKIECKLRGKIINTQNFVTLEIDDTQIREAIQKPLNEIVNAIKSVIEHAPVDIAGDIIDNGILLTGGGAMIRGLDKYISKKLKLSVSIADDPLLSVAKGTAMALDNLNLLKRLDVYR